MKKILVLYTTLIALSYSISFSHADEITPGRELSEQIFGSIEDKPSGAIDMGEFTQFGQKIFASMDYSDDGRIDFKELTEWDFGFSFLAEESKQERAYETAQKILFAFWDRDGDGTISSREYHKSMISDFTRADINDDALLSEDEFLQGYIVIKAYRAAIIGN